MIAPAADRVSDRLLAEFDATLGDWLFAMPDGTAPLGLHWCLAPPLAATASLGADGHPPRAHDVSIAAYPRRMWVGGRLELVAPMRRGQQVTRSTELAPAVVKQGGSGRWCLAAADHRFEAEGRLLLRERQDIAFRPAAGAAPAAAGHAASVPAGDLVWQVATPETLLFRYSALTFNSHRIHYDAPYATAVEGYAGVVVHGPLQATLLLNQAAILLGAAPGHFTYRATAPLIGGSGLVAVARRDGDGVTASIHAADGTMTMQAEARQAPLHPARG